MLGTRALNRALLARQHLLARAEGPVLDLLEHLVGLQAQEPQEPTSASGPGCATSRRPTCPDYSRGARPCGCCSCAARCTSCRPATACACADCTTRCWSPACAARSAAACPASTRRARRRRSTAVRRDAEHLTEVARAVGDRWPQVAARDLGDALSTLLPLVQVPPRGLWRQTHYGTASRRSTAVLEAPPAAPRSTCGSVRSRRSPRPRLPRPSCSATSPPTALRRPPTSVPGRD